MTGKELVIPCCDCTGIVVVRWLHGKRQWAGRGWHDLTCQALASARGRRAVDRYVTDTVGAILRLGDYDVIEARHRRGPAPVG